MSLLIKALNHLEKNKQAERNKKPIIGERLADDALMLSLLPIDLHFESEPSEAQAIVKEPTVFASAAPAKVNLVQNTLGDSAPSLEEEAGLTKAAFTANRFATTAKPSVASDKAANSGFAKSATLNVAHHVLQTSGAKNKNLDQTDAFYKTTYKTTTPALNQKATKVFVANKAPKSTLTLLALGVVGACFILLGLQGYRHLKTFSTPNDVANAGLATSSQAIGTTAEVVVIPPATQIPPPMTDKVQESKTSALALGSHTGEKTNAFANAFESIAELNTKKSRAKPTRQIGDMLDAEVPSSAELKAKHAQQHSVALISKAASSGVDPTLLAAYQAFTRGENTTAQQQYKQVLQHDPHNVDALLGMAAIAQRQGRDADATGWYQKVLEIEPRNTIAQSASVNPQVGADDVSAESRIKNMLAQQPDSANLHAALGGVYAAQNQWSSAQESYFNASRLAPHNADYALNLAISLDQMGKPNLALKQYQRALALLNQSGSTRADSAVVEARIRELQ